MKKQNVIQLLSQLPNEFSPDVFFEKLIVIEKIEEGLEDVRRGRVLTHKHVKNEIKKLIQQSHSPQKHKSTKFH